MSLKLKVKICTLAAESKIIRTQQRHLLKRIGVPPSKLIFRGLSKSEAAEDSFLAKVKELRLERKRHKAKLAIIKMGVKPANIWPELQHHRRHDVREAARSALLAYAFLREREYFSLEHKFHDGNEPNWTQVEKNINRFTREPDPRIVAQRFAEWKQRGIEEQDKYRDQQKAAKAA
jgi:hypothetical protein